jgi:hypothetical protein
MHRQKVKPKAKETTEAKAKIDRTIVRMERFFVILILKIYRIIN